MCVDIDSEVVLYGWTDLNFFFCNLMIVMVVDGSKFYDLEISPMIWQKEYLQYL